jgi:glycerol-3-phosphate dehydrogenase (NAD(P)+)
MYPMPDIIASQIGGALKNVIAIASGICAGKNLGENARAAVITRGIAEIAKLTRAKGGDERNLMGLCGFGDLMLTATSIKSRNYRFGVGIGSGAEEAKTGVIEGYYSAKSVYELAKKLNIEMPICFSVYEILYNNKNIDEAINDLLERPQG